MKNNLHFRLWLTWKLIRKQKLRTSAIICGLTLSCFLLGAFGSFGYDFWAQVHGETGDAAGYDRTQLILIALVAVLLSLAAGCSTICIRNLYSLTFSQRWRSLTRLASLGAGPRDLILMTLLENTVFFCASALTGVTLTVLSVKTQGICSRPPVWLTGGTLLWIWMVSCLCSLRPLRAALRRRDREPLHRGKMFGRPFAKRNSRRKESNRKPKHTPSINFTLYMIRKYRRANRSRHIRIVMTILAAILLYVPAGYLIETNLSVQRAELEAKYGIQYSCSPETREELENALSEYRRLADASRADLSTADPGPAHASPSGRRPADAFPADRRPADAFPTDPGPAHASQAGRRPADAPSVLYVSMPASASVRTDALSRELRSLLHAMGWKEEETFHADSTIYFLENRAYTDYLEAAGIPSSVSAVLINRYVNRSSWSADASPSWQELPLLNTESSDFEEITRDMLFYYEHNDEFQWNETKFLSPGGFTRDIPDGINFDGRLSLILPLERLEDLLPPDAGYRDLYVCGKFQDPDAETFSRMEKILGENSLGSLRNTREILREWYSSMNGIHRAMDAICTLLFSIAVLNIFSMMVFQYLERKRGLAILWSLGQSPGELLKILTGEHLRNLSAAILLGIPVSGLLCRCIYNIFRQVWQVEFVFPLREILPIGAAACALSFLAVLAEGLLMRRHDFLAEIRDIL